MTAKSKSILNKFYFCMKIGIYKADYDFFFVNFNYYGENYL